MEHPSANLPPSESSPAPLMHHVTWLIQTARYHPPTPISELLSLPQGQPIALGQINSLRQIYGTKSIPDAIPLKSPGFYTWERCEAYCIKADFFPSSFHLPLYEFEMSSSAHDLFMLSRTFKLCGFFFYTWCPFTLSFLVKTLEWLASKRKTFWDSIIWHPPFSHWNTTKGPHGLDLFLFLCSPRRKLS